ncbi:helix-turn-helix domain-containing protein [Streptomyces sp. 891-h]|uniref:helix-turn-helix domain-containing protein n=1 Tax=Streptomyces sp. 891-h TaxID=2720714 RepID=UPI001FAA4080|nr:helix-turn-helix domain-containing protein [Streptomyces sp. 891-h]UNZ15992.1 helix-turn-helix domain-containing protein [Streptomyces sp. 891-h]
MRPREAAGAAGIGVVAASEHIGRPRLHRALPALSARLVVSLGPPMDIRYGGHARSTQAVIAGMMRPGVATPALTLRPSQPIVYVDLSPLAAQRLVGVPLSEVDAGGVDADALLPWMGRLSEELADRPASQRETLMRLRLLEKLARVEGTAQRCGSRDAFEALKIIEAGGGQVSVEELARRVHLSPRRLRQVMRSELGIGPKFASRVARLAAAVRRVGDGADSWTRIAAESAYHDQSHLVHDFRELMCTTPTAWLAEEGRNLQGRRRPAP